MPMLKLTTLLLLSNFPPNIFRIVKKFIKDFFVLKDNILDKKL